LASGERYLLGNFGLAQADHRLSLECFHKYNFAALAVDGPRQALFLVGSPEICLLVARVLLVSLMNARFFRPWLLAEFALRDRRM